VVVTKKNTQKQFFGAALHYDIILYNDFFMTVTVCFVSVLFLIFCNKIKYIIIVIIIIIIKYNKTWNCI